jgi:hypothetical protein
MKNTTKILLTVLILGLIYSFIKLFSGQGGSGIYDFFDALAISSVALFLASFLAILINIKRLKENVIIFIFLILGLPLSISILNSKIEEIKYNRSPDLSPKYPRPIDQAQYNSDSINVQLALDSYVALKNRNSHNSEIMSAFIDTMIYSQKGDKLFVLFGLKYYPNDYGNSFVSSAFFADKRDSVFWNLEEARYRYSGDFKNINILKKEVRKFYFNQFKFSDKDSLNDNYFWNKMKRASNTIIVN